MSDAERPPRLVDADRLWPAPNVLSERVGEEMVLNDEGHGRIHVLNASAAHVWELCNEQLTVGEVAERLGASFGMTAADVRDDVDLVLRDFATLGLLEERPGPSR